MWTDGSAGQSAVRANAIAPSRERTAPTKRHRCTKAASGTSLASARPHVQPGRSVGDPTHVEHDVVRLDRAGLVEPAPRQPNPDAADRPSILPTRRIL